MARILGLLILSLPLAAQATPSGPTTTHMSPMTAPEIDPGTALSGLTLLVGGLAVIRGRRGRK